MRHWIQASLQNKLKLKYSDCRREFRQPTSAMNAPPLPPPSFTERRPKTRPPGAIPLVRWLFHWCGLLSYWPGLSLCHCHPIRQTEHTSKTFNPWNNNKKTEFDRIPVISVMDMPYSGLAPRNRISFSLKTNLFYVTHYYPISI